MAIRLILLEKDACNPNPLVNVFDINTFQCDTDYDPKDGKSLSVNKGIYKVICGK